MKRITFLDKIQILIVTMISSTFERRWVAALGFFFRRIIIFAMRLIMLQTVENQRRQKARTKPLYELFRFADLFGLPTRNAIKAMAADYSVEIRRIRRERRPWVARWNVGLAWCYAIWFILRSPADRLLQYLIKSFRGG